MVATSELYRQYFRNIFYFMNKLTVKGVKSFCAAAAHLLPSVCQSPKATSLLIIVAFFESILQICTPRDTG
ncbi:hypothetical protein QE435_004922 [Rhizobium sp. SORGH_AS 787]|nr:hypothetical protein [Rhizobium sp. SORGH_AS_0787]